MGIIHERYRLSGTTDPLASHAEGIRQPQVSEFINECSKVDPEIQVFGDGTYQPCRGGQRAFQVPVYDRYGEPFDIVAWFHANPSEWWTRRGLATILGEQALLKAEWRGEPGKHPPSGSRG